MSDTRDRLAEILHKQGAYCGTCDYESRDCPDCASVLEGYATAILAEFLVIPRTDITTGYGFQYFTSGQWETVETEDRQQAIDGAAYLRDSEGAEWPTPARAVEHLKTAWSPIPLPENGQQ